MDSREFILAGPGRDRCRRGLRSGHGLVGIPLVLIIHGDLMVFFWGFNRTIYNNLGI